MKKLIFGIVLILFGICCLISGNYWDADPLMFLGTISPFAGLFSAILGLAESSNEANK